MHSMLHKMQGRQGARSGIVQQLNVLMRENPQVVSNLEHVAQTNNSPRK